MTSRERVTLDDASWLHMDSDDNPMVVNTLVLFRARPDWDAVTAAFHTRVVATFPRFRQRVVQPLPRLGAIGGPYWEDDPDFGLTRHLQRVTLPDGEFESALQAHLGREASTLIDPHRPRWVLQLVDGADGHAAALLRTHHSMADGIALVQVLLAWADRPSSGGAHTGQMPLASQATPGRAGARVETVGDRMVAFANPARWLEASVEARDKQRVYRKLISFSDEATSLGSSLVGTKTVGWSPAVAFDEIRSVARSAGATVNDLSLAVLAGAVRRYLLAQGEVPRRVGATIPYNLRDLDAPIDPALGNQIGLVFVSLPVDLAEPRSRLAAVQERMAEIKASPEGEVVRGGMAMVGAMPTRTMASAWMAMFTGKCAAIVTNIVGPRSAIGLGGMPVEDLLMWVPTSGSIGIGLSVVSYDGRLRLGVQADRGVIPDLGELVAAITVELEELDRFVS